MPVVEKASGDRPDAEGGRYQPGDYQTVIELDQRENWNQAMADNSSA